MLETQKIQQEIQDEVYERVTHTLHFFKDYKFNHVVLYEDYMPMSYDTLLETISNVNSLITNSTYNKGIIK